MNCLCLGIFAHIDAGKTTLTERLLFLSGAIRQAGSVDGGTSVSDFLPVERARGISVRDASLSFSYGGTEFFLIDTPGHADFAEECDLAFGAVDAAVLVISAPDGIRPQTELLLSAARTRGIPTVVFYNKCDRGLFDDAGVRRRLAALSGAEVLAIRKTMEAEDAVAALGDEALLERYLGGTLTEAQLDDAVRAAVLRGSLLPFFYGSARTGEDCEALLAFLSRLQFAREEDFSAYVYQVTHHPSLGKVAHIKLFGGELHVRDEVPNSRTGSRFKATQVKTVRGGRFFDVSVLRAGEAGAVTGLGDVRAGDCLGRNTEPRAPLSVPYLRVRILPKAGGDEIALKRALEELCEEQPGLALEWVEKKRECVVSVTGSIRVEVLLSDLWEKYGIEAAALAPSVIYRETIVQAGYGFEAYTMPKPCWAVVQFYMEPLPRGCGLVYESICSEKRMAYRYQNHVKTAVKTALEEGRMGWQVTDLKVTLVDGEDHPVHTHPLDFFVATPMGIHDGLRNCGTRLLEPVLAVRITAPEETVGKLLAELSRRRARFSAPCAEDGIALLEAEVPAAEAMDLAEKTAALTGGRGVYDARLLGFYPCPEGMGAVRERTSLDPLDRAKWILHARGAL